MRRIVLTGGGTAGHVSPHLALIPRLLSEGWDIHYIGTKQGIERQLIAPFEAVTYHAISSGKLRRYFDVKNFTDPFRVIAGSAQSLGLIRRLKPDVIFSKGGFVSVPVSYAAWLCGVPLVLHESDYTPGLANRIIAPMAKAVCTSFPETAAMIAKGRGRFTGTPLRAELFTGNAAQACMRFGLCEGKATLLVTGGSLGAQAVNTAVRMALPKLLARFQVLHLCGNGNLDDACDGMPGYHQIEYLSEGMNDAFAIADVVVSRAGSNTLMELLALRKPTLYIPYPRSASRGEQESNARSMEKRGFAGVLLQENMTPETLVAAISDLYEQRQPMVSAMQQVPRDEGLEKVYDIIMQHAK